MEKLGVLKKKEEEEKANKNNLKKEWSKVLQIMFKNGFIEI